MNSGNGFEDSVGRHYDDIFKYEINRLPTYCPVEYALTTRLIDRWIPENAIVGEVGVGGGHYTGHLAERGCQLYLADVSQRLLERVVESLSMRGFSGSILSAEHASGTDLHSIPDGVLDALLFMGPLYHLCSPDLRLRAIREAARVLKTGGLVFAAGINRLTYLRDLFRQTPGAILDRHEFHGEFLRDGNLDPKHAPPIGFAHLTTREEFQRLFVDDFREEALLAVESFTSPWQEQFSGLSDEVAAAWLDLVEQTARHPDTFGIADHFLYIGRKK